MNGLDIYELRDVQVRRVKSKGGKKEDEFDVHRGWKGENGDHRRSKCGG